MFQRYNKIFIALGLVIALGSCKTAIKPEPPDEIDIAKVYKKENSSINLPLEIQISQLQKTANEELKGVLYEDKSFEDNGVDNIKMKVKKIKPFSIYGKDAALYFDVPLNIWADYRQKVAFGRALTKDTDMDIKLRFKTELKMNKKWELTTKTKALGFKWIKKPKVSFGGLTIPITGIIEDILEDELQGIADILDDEVKNSINSRELMKDLWKDIQVPMLVDSEYAAWLKIEPKQFVMTEIKGDKEKLALNVGMDGHLEIVMGQKPNYIVQSRLPDLVIKKKNADDFNVTLATEITFAKATEIMKDEFIGYEYESGKRKIKVTDMEVFGVGDQLGCRVDITGSVKGSFYMKGTPQYDTATSEIYLDPFDFDVKSKNALLNSAEWMLHGPIKKRIAKYIRYPMDSIITEYTAIAEKSLNDNPISEGVHMNVKIDKVYPKECFMTENSIRTYLFIGGRAKLLYGEKEKKKK